MWVIISLKTWWWHAFWSDEEGLGPIISFLIHDPDMLLVLLFLGSRGKLSEVEHICSDGQVIKCRHCSIYVRVERVWEKIEWCSGEVLWFSGMEWLHIEIPLIDWPFRPHGPWYHRVCWIWVQINRSAVRIIYSVVLLRGSLSTYLPIFGVTLCSFSLFGTVWLWPHMVHL